MNTQVTTNAQRHNQIIGKENNSEISNMDSQNYMYNKNSDIQRMLNYKKVTKNLNQQQDYNNYKKPIQQNKINNSKPFQQQDLNQPMKQPQLIQHSKSLPVEPTIRDFSVTDQSTEKLPKPAISQKEQDNFNLLQTYSTEILDHMKATEVNTTPVNCLERHEVPANLRAKMVDWMIEVLSSYKCTEQTFFLAVRLMDKYYELCPEECKVSELHLVGVTCMFIACKYEEIYPMKLKVVHDKISHKKLSEEQIKDKESQILSVIQFNIVGSTPYDLSIHTLFKTDLRQKLQPKIYNYLQKICTYLSKMVLYDYSLVSQRSYALLSGSLIYVAFKIIEQINPDFKVDTEILPIKKLLNVSYDKLIETAQKVLNLAKNFDKQYPQLDNLKKFNGFSLEDDNNNTQ